jgi:hypothetical protein
MQARGEATLQWSRPLKEGVDVALKLGERADGFVKAHAAQEALLRRLFCVRLAYVPLQGGATRRTTKSVNDESPGKTSALDGSCKAKAVRVAPNVMTQLS